MRKFFSERNLVIVLFIAAFAVFALAQQDTTKLQQMQMNTSVAPFHQPVQPVAITASQDSAITE